MHMYMYIDVLYVQWHNMCMHMAYMYIPENQQQYNIAMVGNIESDTSEAEDGSENDR